MENKNTKTSNKTEVKGEVLQIKLVRSLAGRDKRTKATADSLGLYKIGASVTIAKNASTIGKVEKLKHLLEVK